MTFPTGNGRDDFKRGKEYAALTIEVMTADGCAWYLEKIIEAIVADAVWRKAKGGRTAALYRRLLTGSFIERRASLARRSPEFSRQARGVLELYAFCRFLRRTTPHFAG